MRSLFRQIRKIARAEGPVVIIGASGVGKELVAQAVHAESERRQEPFVPVNCASIPENLLESELFGHLPGAFTGAAKKRKGLFLEANGGVLFLDEVTERPVSMQAKLLRVLQEGRIRKWAPTGRRGSMCGWWWQRTPIWRRKWRREGFARTFITGWKPSRSRCRRFASAAGTSSSWRPGSCRCNRKVTTARPAVFLRRRLPCSVGILFPEMCASFKIS